MPSRLGRHRPVLATGAAILGAQVLMAAGGILSARALGPDGKGVVSAVFAWPMMLSWAGLFGLNTALTVRVAADAEANLRSALGNSLTLVVVSGTAIAVAAIGVVPSSLAHLGPDADLLATVALATIPVVMLADVLLSLSVALGRIRQANISRLVGPTLILVCTAALVATGRLTVGLLVAITITASFVSLLVVSVGLPWRRVVIGVGSLLRDLRFGIKVHLGGLIGYANMRLDILLMSTFVAASQIGYYSVANNVMIPVASLAAAAAALATPSVARLGGGDGESGFADQTAFIRREARLYLWLALTGGIALAVVGPFLIPVLFGSAFRPAVVLVWILIPGYVMRAYSLIVISGAAGMRRSWVGNAAEGAGLVLTLVLLPLLLPRYGAVGAAVTSTAAYTASAVVAWLSLSRLAGPNAAGGSQDVPLRRGFRHGLQALSRPFTG